MKYNRSQIMKRAHELRRIFGMNKSTALTQSWKEAKGKAPKYHDQKTAYAEAFKAKYPTGTIQILQYWAGAKVQFTATGKSYTYLGHGWQTRLGVTA